MKKFYFTGGLPRAGNTLLCSILNQNSKVYATGMSCLPEVFFRLLKMAEDDIAYQTSPCPESLQNIFVNLFETFYKHRDEEVIIERSSWTTPFNYQIVSEYCPNDVKILILVRPVVDIVKSYLKICERSPLFYINQQYNFIDKSTLYKSEIETKVDLILQKEGEIDRNLYSMKWLIDNEYTDNVRVLDYDTFISDPKKYIEYLYQWYDIPKYEHTYEDLNQVGDYGVFYSDDVYLKAHGVHTIRTDKIDKIENDIELPDHVVDFCNSLNVWEGNIKHLGD
tara:strand:- start:43 stop:882 length:840 start_codon:yes stop_codon:yes gene_type:complete